jgi:hypothetical protein
MRQTVRNTSSTRTTATTARSTRSEWSEGSERIKWSERITKSEWRLWIWLILRQGLDERLETLMGSSNPHFDSLAIVVRDHGESLAIRLSLLLLGGQLLNDATLLKTLGVLLNESLGDRVMRLVLEQDVIESCGVDGREREGPLSKLVRITDLIACRV